MKWMFGVLAMAFPLFMNAQEKVVPLKYGDMDQWITRKIHESGIIGGDTKLLYEVGPVKELDGNTPYVNQGGSPWGNSNVMAKVMGIVKTNTSVYPEQREGGYCARLETHIESVKVLGVVNITVLASGSLFLGDMKEPMGQDCAIMTCLLQKRTEDAEGNIIAKRIGTAVIRYQQTEGWRNKATYDIHYGDISHTSYYDAELMKLGVGNYHARNSKGESVLIQENGWADADETPTHLILQFTSSLGGAFVGSPGNTLWVDNVCLVY